MRIRQTQVVVSSGVSTVVADADSARVRLVMNMVGISPIGISPGISPTPWPSALNLFPGSEEVEIDLNDEPDLCIAQWSAATMFGTLSTKVNVIEWLTD